MRKILFASLALMSICASAQSVKHYYSKEGAEWKVSKSSLSAKAEGETVVAVDGKERGVP